MVTILDLIIYSIGAVLLVVWLVFYAIGRKNASFFNALDEKEYPFKEVYFLGYAVVETFNYKYTSKGDRKLRKELSVLYGDKYAEYYIRVIYAQKVFFSFTLLALTVPLYGLVNSTIMLGMGPLYAGLAYYYFGTVTSKKILKRSEEMLRDFSNVVSKLALLTNAGMIMREAWEEVAYTGESTLYKEMQTAVDEMNNGIAEVEALFRFGTRCIIPEIKKFTSTIVQGILKGNSELTFMLQEQSKEVWSLKKQDVRRQGEKAASKLLIPIMMMFVGVLIMIIVPIFTNMGA